MDEMRHMLLRAYTYSRISTVILTGGLQLTLRHEPLQL
jgi:hypothetical protein